jgi:hypothetical protein
MGVAEVNRRLGSGEQFRERGERVVGVDMIGFSPAGDHAPVNG